MTHHEGDMPHDKGDVTYHECDPIVGIFVWVMSRSIALWNFATSNIVCVHPFIILYQNISHRRVISQSYDITHIIILLIVREHEFSTSTHQRGEEGGGAVREEGRKGGWERGKWESGKNKEKVRDGGLDVGREGWTLERRRERGQKGAREVETQRTRAHEKESKNLQYFQKIGGTDLNLVVQIFLLLYSSWSGPWST